MNTAPQDVLRRSFLRAARVRAPSPGRKGGVDRGFSLVELFVIMIIISILVAIAIPVFLDNRTQAKLATVRSDLRANAMVLQNAIMSTGGGSPPADSLSCSPGISLLLETSAQPAPEVICTGGIIAAGPLPTNRRPAGLVMLMTKPTATPTPSSVTPTPSSVTPTPRPTTPVPTPSSVTPTPRPTTPSTASTSSVPTTPAPTTAVPTTQAPTSDVPTTQAPTTAVPTTPAPADPGTLPPLGAWFCLTAVSAQVADQPWHWDSRSPGEREGACPGVAAQV